MPLPRWAVVPASSSATIRPAPASITSVVDAARLRELRRRPELTEVPLSDPMGAAAAFSQPPTSLPVVAALVQGCPRSFACRAPKNRSFGLFAGGGSARP